MTNHLLLLRHGKHEADLPDQPSGRRLSANGEKETKEVIEKLADVLSEFRSDNDLSFDVKEIWRASTPEVVKTAAVVRQILKGLSDEDKTLQELSPEVFNPYKNTGIHTRVAARFRDWARSSRGNEAILVIGNQPFLSWLANELTENAIPLVHSEVACIAFDNASIDKPGTLRWVLSPSNELAGEDLKELKEKIKSKMEIAKLLGAAIMTVLAFLLGYMIDESKVKEIRNYWGAEWALRLSTVAFFIATALYLATMYAYDRLLMPSRFWGEARPPANPDKRPQWLVWRPPSSALWVLYQNMMHIWRYHFTSATYAVFVGLVFLAYAVFHPNGWRTISLFWGGIIVGLLLFRIFYDRFGPRLGSED